METASRSLLTFLLNSLWQIPLAAMVAALACRMMRSAPAAYRNAVWIAALGVAILLPAASSRRAAAVPGQTFDAMSLLRETAPGAVQRQTPRTDQPAQPAAQTVSPRGAISLTQSTAIALISAYLLFVLFRLSRLVIAFLRTRHLQRAHSEPPSAAIGSALVRCQAAFGVDGIQLVFSNGIAAPANAGGTILLPEGLRDETSEEVLLTAIGHEMAHIARRDFAWNLLLESLGLTVAFHPAAWLIRREIVRSREAACDELVAEHLLDAGAYARSILRLAAAALSPAAPLCVLSALDGDDLEARIRRLTHPRTGSRRPRLLLGAGLGVLALAAVVASTLSLTARAQSPAADLVKSATAAYERGDFAAAVNQLREAVRRDPGNAETKIALANALVHPQESFKNKPAEVISEARQLYADALAIQPKSKPATHGMLFLLMNTKQYAEARQVILNGIQADPGDADLYYSAGVLDWFMTYPDYAAARKQAGMQNADPGIIPDAALRKQIRDQHGAQLEDGFRMLQIALQLNPDSSSAMAYMNLLDRIQAAISDTSEEYAQYIAKADDWVKQALAAKRKSLNQTPSDHSDIGLSLPAPPPSPPPPPPGHQAGPLEGHVIHVAPEIQAKKITFQVQPLYPAEARQAGIEGQVTMNAIIASDGSVSSLDVVSGDPVLAQAAARAVRQWKYAPTLLNEQPVAVATQVRIIYTLGHQ